MNQLSREQAYLLTGSLLLCAAVAGAFTLSYTKVVAVPFVLSILIARLVSPLADFLETRLRFPRALSVISILVVLVGVVGFLVLLLYISTRGIAANANLYVERLNSILESLVMFAADLPPDLLPFEVEAEHFDLKATLGSIKLDPLLGVLQNTAGSVLTATSSFIGNGLLVLVFSVYLIAGRTPRDEQTGIFRQIDDKIRIYLGTKFLTSATTGLLTWLILYLFGLDLALIFGVLAFLLNFIPTIGSIIAVFLPLPIALIQFDTVWPILMIVFLPGILQFSIGNLLEPKLMGDSLDLHPLTVLTGLLFWGLLWGPVGTLLATPIIAVLKIVMEQLEFTQPLSEFMAGRLPQLRPEAPTEPSGP